MPAHGDSQSSGQGRGISAPGMAGLAQMINQAAPALPRAADEVVQLHGPPTLKRLATGEVELQIICGNPDTYYRIYAYRMTAGMASELGTALLRAAVGDTDD